MNEVSILKRWKYLGERYPELMMGRPGDQTRKVARPQYFFITTKQRSTPHDYWDAINNNSLQKAIDGGEDYQIFKLMSIILNNPYRGWRIIYENRKGEKKSYLFEYHPIYFIDRLLAEFNETGLVDYIGNGAREIHEWGYVVPFGGFYEIIYNVKNVLIENKDWMSIYGKQVYTPDDYQMTVWQMCWEVVNKLDSLSISHDSDVVINTGAGACFCGKCLMKHPVKFFKQISLSFLSLIKGNKKIIKSPA